MKVNKSTDIFKGNVFSSFFNRKALSRAIEGCDESERSIVVTLIINKRTRRAVFKALRKAYITRYFLLIIGHYICFTPSSN